MNDVKASLDSLEAGRFLNPNDTWIMADLGLRYALLTDWDKASPLLQESFLRNPVQPLTYRIGLSQFHYMQGHYEDALAEARKVGAGDVVYGYLVTAISAAQLGLKDEAATSIANIIEIDPLYGDHVAQDLERHNVSHKIISAIIEGLAKVGLAGRDIHAAR